LIFSLDNVHYLELLSTEFIKSLPSSINPSFLTFLVRTYYHLALFNIQSEYLSTLPKGLIDLFKAYQREMLDFGGLLEGPKNMSISKPLIWENKQGASRKELITYYAKRPEKSQIYWFNEVLKILWAYLKQNFKEGKLSKSMDFELVSKMVKKINAALEKLNNYTGLIQIEDGVGETLYQCSFCLERFHKENLVTEKILVENFESLRSFTKKTKNLRM